jgi:TnpA family transposase
MSYRIVSKIIRGTAWYDYDTTQIRHVSAYHAVYNSIVVYNRIVLMQYNVI